MYRHAWSEELFQQFVWPREKPLKLKRLGKKKWRRHVEDVVGQLKNALQAEYVVIGGGNARLLIPFAWLPATRMEAVKRRGPHETCSELGVLSR